MNNLAFPIKLAALLVCLAWGVASAAPADVPERESRSSAGFQNDRPTDARRDPLKLESSVAGELSKKLTKRNSLQSAGTQSILCCSTRFYSVDTELFDDFDNDGYYTYLRVNFDVDTDLIAEDVYAVLYLALPGEPFEVYYETDVFTIFGSSPNDDYEVETEFVGGYPPGEYDLFIEIYDAHNDDQLVEIGPEDSSALSYLPIEDLDFDTDAEVRVAVSSGGGGSISWLTLFLVSLLLLRGRRS